MAVLLDNFVTASSMIEEEENQRILEEKRRRHLAKNPLEPLLQKIAKEFLDDSDLSNKLSHLYKVAPRGVASLQRALGSRCEARVVRALMGLCGHRWLCG